MPTLCDLGALVQLKLFSSYAYRRSDLSLSVLMFVGFRNTWEFVRKRMDNVVDCSKAAQEVHNNLCDCSYEFRRAHQPEV